MCNVTLPVVLRRLRRLDSGLRLDGYRLLFRARLSTSFNRFLAVRVVMTVTIVTMTVVVVVVAVMTVVVVVAPESE